jgi:hypothetical protein
MKKILLLLCLLVSFASCGKSDPDNTKKLEYELTVSGDINLLDSTVVAKIYRVFTNDTTKLQLDDTIYVQDDELAQLVVNSLKATDSISEDPSSLEGDVLFRISPELYAYYIYIIGYVKDSSTGIIFEIDKKFVKNWGDKPIPVKP